MSIASKGRKRKPLSEETKRKISESNKGVKRSAESVKRVWEVRRKNGNANVKWAKSLSICSGKGGK